MELGFIGLGKMGGAMVVRLHAAGHKVVGFDVNAGCAGRAKDRGIAVANSLEELADALTPPRIVWTMTPPGAPTIELVRMLSALLSAGDLIVDGGNSDFRDSRQLASELKAKDIAFVDAGVSGGTQGARNGCGLLVGAEPRHFERLIPIFEALAIPGAYALVGGNGAGHFTKAVHNGVEYALMQAYGEGYELLAASDIGVDVEATLAAWQHGCSIRSHLLEKLCQAIAGNPGLDGIKGFVADSGMGRWTVEEAIRLRVPTPAIAIALQARFGSQQEDSPAMKSIAALRGVIGGHAVMKTGDAA
jgi:6-phosphogluconate dehydrogenase